MNMPGRGWKAQEHRFGFQNQETDEEFWGGAVSYKYRIHDPRLGRFFSVDPLAPEYPWNSVYAFSENRVVDGVELEGLEFTKVTGTMNIGDQKVDVFVFKVKVQLVNSSSNPDAEFILNTDLSGHIRNAEKILSRRFVEMVENESDQPIGLDYKLFVRTNIEYEKDDLGFPVFVSKEDVLSQEHPFYIEFVDEIDPRYVKGMGTVDATLGKVNEIGNVYTNRVRVNIGEDFNGSKLERTDLGETIAHELGHAGGLRHDDYESINDPENLMHHPSKGGTDLKEDQFRRIEKIVPNE